MTSIQTITSFKLKDISVLPRLAVVYSIFLIACLAQGGGVDTSGTGGRHSIQGRIVFPSGQRVDIRLKVKLESSGFGDLSVFSDNNGSFSFKSLRAGNYTVIIDGGEFYETVRETVFIEPATVSSRRMQGTLPVGRPFTLQIYLRAKNQASTAKPAVVNAALAGVPKPAVTLYDQALSSITRGERDKAIDFLQQAVALHPNFGLALNELGVQYLKAGKPERAAEALLTAITLMPDDFQPRLNYGAALLNQRKYAAAEAPLREAIKRNSSASTAHMYLGIVLIHLKNYEAATLSLEKAITLGGDKVAQAHYYLGGLYWKAGEFRRAADELDRFLELDPNAVDASKIRETIRDLRSKAN